MKLITLLLPLLLLGCTGKVNSPKKGAIRVESTRYIVEGGYDLLLFTVDDCEYLMYKYSRDQLIHHSNCHNPKHKL